MINMSGKVFQGCSMHVHCPVNQRPRIDIGFRELLNHIQPLKLPTDIIELPLYFLFPINFFVSDLQSETWYNVHTLINSRRPPQTKPMGFITGN